MINPQEHALIYNELQKCQLVWFIWSEKERAIYCSLKIIIIKAWRLQPILEKEKAKAKFSFELGNFYMYLILYKWDYYCYVFSDKNSKLDIIFYSLFLDNAYAITIFTFLNFQFQMYKLIKVLKIDIYQIGNTRWFFS